ncbi:MAG: hypothetical protein HW417_294 [Steroidobacteraceae bacterium]|nr:hypothetical protein [Steroidobacteraceae bacterium]MBM2853366.1 hypothetical protein [Steroidobacteraceae bacterium]
MLRSTRLKLASAVVLAVASIARANAYIDPGTGSMLLQMFGAAVAGGIFYFHELRRTIMSLFSRRPVTSADAGGERPTDDRIR